METGGGKGGGGKRRRRKKEGGGGVIGKVQEQLPVCISHYPYAHSQQRKRGTSFRIYRLKKAARMPDPPH